MSHSLDGGVPYVLAFDEYVLASRLVVAIAQRPACVID